MDSDDEADLGGADAGYDPALTKDPDILAFRISGAFFSSGRLQASARSSTRSRSIPKPISSTFSAVQAIDSTAAAAIGEFKRKARRAGAAVFITGASRPIRRSLLMHGVRRVRFKPDVPLAGRRPTRRLRPERAARRVEPPRPRHCGCAGDRVRSRPRNSLLARSPAH